jgi:hypothetical protein
MTVKSNFQNRLRVHKQHKTLSKRFMDSLEWIEILSAPTYNGRTVPTMILQREKIATIALSMMVFVIGDGF